MNYFFGFSYWKHGFVEPFFEQKSIFINTFSAKRYLEKALKRGLNQHSRIFIWGKKNFPDVERYAHLHGIKIYRVEDGFIRSVGLGSDLTQPFSLVVDSLGIYFDPTQPSDLEMILQNHLFTSEEIGRAQKIREYMIEKRLSKYNLYENVELQLPDNRHIIVVPGQVEDDASIIYGAQRMTNLELLQQVRRKRPEAYILYKPHPDVLVGNRIGHIDENEALRFCDRVVTEVGIDTVLAHADEVHTMTSLVGFEAMMRGIDVFTYGRPFYAGWGLSEDIHTIERRTRRLTLDELVAGTYLIYPRYLHPDTLKPCSAEELLAALDSRKNGYNQSFTIRLRNWLSRKLQLYIRIFKGM